MSKVIVVVVNSKIVNIVIKIIIYYIIILYMFYFLHIPKSGGTLVRNIISSTFDEIDIYEIQSENETNIPSNIKIICNELSIGTTLFTTDIKCFTIIRNPIDRLLSHIETWFYNSNKRLFYDDIEKNKIIHEWIERSRIDSYGLFTRFTFFNETLDIDINKKKDTFYNNLIYFTIFELEDNELEEKMKTFFQNNGVILKGHFRKSHTRIERDIIPLTFNQLSKKTQNEILTFLKYDIEFYEYITNKKYDHYLDKI
jgi:hypothetical protein